MAVLAQPSRPALHSPLTIPRQTGDHRMPSRKRRMNLIAYLKTGPTANHPGSWRHPEADLHDIFEPTRYESLARILETARFDAGFFADTIGLPDMHKGGYETYLGMGG